MICLRVHAAQCLVGWPDVERIEAAQGARAPDVSTRRLQIQPGDKLHAIETKEGILLTPCVPTFDDAMQAFAQVRRQYRKTLEKLSE